VVLAPGRVPGRERRVRGRPGQAALGSIGTAVYRGRVPDSIPADAPRPSSGGGARDRFAGAEAATNSLSHQAGADLLEYARESFTAGLNAVRP